MSSETLIPNELLAFIQHAIDTMDEISILQICKSNFKIEEICSGKELLYKTLGMADRMPSRRRDEKGERSLQDIINLLKVTDPDDVPAFVAKQLHKLPPVTFDHVDVTRLLKDINTLKASLAEVQCRLEVSESTISDLRTELLTLKSNDSVSRSDTSNVNTRRGGTQNVSISSLPSPSPPVVARVAQPAARGLASVQMTSSPGASTPRAYAEAAAVPAPVSTPVAAPPKSQATRAKTKKKSKAAPAKALPPSGPERNLRDEEGFIKVERKKKKPSGRNNCGTAPIGTTPLLRPAVPSTPLYVSRLHWSTKVEEVVDYVRSKSNFTLRVERLQSHHKSNFNSFVIRVPTHHLSTFMKEDFWPQGIVFRRFRGRLPNDTALNTSPSLRVT